MFSGSLTKRCSLDGSAEVHWWLQLVLIQLALETSADVAKSLWACVAKGRWDLRHACCGISVTILWRRCDSLFCACLESASVAASLLMEAGAIPARMGSWFTGVACRVPEIVRRALLRMISSFFDMVTTTPNWGTVIYSREHQGLGRYTVSLLQLSMWFQQGGILEQLDLWSLL